MDKWTAVDQQEVSGVEYVTVTREQWDAAKAVSDLEYRAIQNRAKRQIEALEHERDLYRRNCQYWMDQYSLLHKGIVPIEQAISLKVAEHQTDPRLGYKP